MARIEELSSKVDKLLDSISMLIRVLQPRVERRCELDRGRLEATR